MSDKSESPFSARLRARLIAMGWSVSRQDARVIQRAFVEALKEEVAARYRGEGVTTSTAQKPLVIAGLGSFKMRTRPAREFSNLLAYREDAPAEGDLARSPRIVKEAARRLVFTAKWEEIK